MRAWREAALGTLVYFVSARLGLTFSLYEGGVSPVWPPSGVLLGLALVLGPRLAIGAAIGALVNDMVTHGGPLAVSPLVGLGAGLECWTATWLLRRFDFDRRMPRVRDVVLLVGIASLVPLIASASGTLALLLSHQAPLSAGPQVFRTWWVGDALGIVSFTPALLAFIDTPRQRWNVVSRVEAVSTVGLLISSSVAVFLVAQQPWLASGTLVFAVVPVMAMVWIALRFDQRTAAMAMLVVSGAAIVGSSSQRGAFAGVAPSDRVWLLQLYILLCSVTTFTTASLSADRRAQIGAMLEREGAFERASRLTGVGGFSWDISDPVPRWSPRLHAIFGIPLVDRPLTLRDAVTMMLPDDRARYEDLLERLRETPEPYRFSFSFVRRDGAVRHAEALAEPVFDGDGRLTRWDGAIQDVTERVENEAKVRAMNQTLQQAQQLESLGLLAGGVAHDFNNLLAVILTNTEVVSARAPLTDELRGALTEANAAAKAAAGICRQMLTFAGREQPKLESIDVSSLARETGRLVSHAFMSQVEVRYDLAHDLPLIRADPTQLTQTIMNLLLNAAEAVGPKGEVLVRTGTRSFTEEDLLKTPKPAALVGERCVFLLVQDNGAGMSEATRLRIFQPFFTTKKSGRGLGLAATLGTLDQHGGAITVESTVGKGTRFTLWFPLAPTP